MLFLKSDTFAPDTVSSTWYIPPSGKPIFAILKLNVVGSTEYLVPGAVRSMGCPLNHHVVVYGSEGGLLIGRLNVFPTLDVLALTFISSGGIVKQISSKNHYLCALGDRSMKFGM